MTVRPIAWNYGVIFIMGVIMGYYSLDIHTKVDIMSLKVYGDNILITCSVSSSSANDVREHNVYLHCPLLGNDKICYINCESLLVTSQGIPVFTDVLSDCQRTWHLQHRVEFQYVVNRIVLDSVGEWYCVYKNKRSSNITIRKYKPPPTYPTTSLSRTTQQGTSARPPSCTKSMMCPAQSDNSSLIAGSISLLCVSAICNILLALLLCFFRYDNRRCRRRSPCKEDKTVPPEAVSMLLMNSNRQLGPNSSCSFTPSLDSPSNKESLSTYIQDTLYSNSFQTPLYYVHPGEYTIMNVRSPTNDKIYNIEGAKVLRRQYSEDLDASRHAFVPPTPKHKYSQQRRSAQLPYSRPSPQSANSQQIPFLVGRTYNSHQQLLHDSNDESGLGSESLCNYNNQKPSQSVGGSDTVDLIPFCDPNLILTRSIESST